MIIECSYCEAKVEAVEIAEHKTMDPDFFVESRVALTKCPICKNAIIIGQKLLEVKPGKHEWAATKRLWPDTDEHLDDSLPEAVRSSLKEAMKCFHSKAYIACASMCSRVLEGIYLDCKPKTKALSDGLKGLLDSKIIDSRMYEWGESLNGQRKIGAHASEKKISRADAQYLLDFTSSICDYIYVMNSRHEKYVNRNAANN